MTLFRLLSLFLPAATTSWTTLWWAFNQVWRGGKQKRHCLALGASEIWFRSASPRFPWQTQPCARRTNPPRFMEVNAAFYSYDCAKKKKKKPGSTLGEATDNILQHIYLKRPQDKQSHGECLHHSAPVHFQIERTSYSYIIDCYRRP